MQRQSLARARCLVVKVGTGTLTGADGRFDRDNCERLAAEIAAAARSRRLVLVSSGAIALGAERLGLGLGRTGKPWDIATKQAAAAVGQPHLMAEWGRALGAHGLQAAQVLLTAEDLASRKRFLNARRTFSRLLERRVVPVVNENDTVAVDEIKVGDNDSLAALVASCVEAELVGMLTELKAARRLAAHGVATALLSGRRPRALGGLLAGERVGTFFPPAAERLPARKGWLAVAAKGKGTILVDAGARRALVTQGRSLLPSGVRSVAGHFGVGDPVDIAVERGRPFARGLAGYGADEVRRIAGLKTGEIEGALGYKYLDEVVHRNDLVLLDTAHDESAR